MSIINVSFTWDCFTVPNLLSAFGIEAVITGGPVPQGQELHWTLDRAVPWLEDHGYKPASTVVEAGKRLRCKGFVRPVVWRWSR